MNVINDFKKHQVLFLIIFVLIGIKFAIVPVFEWQRTQLEQLEMQQLRQVKARNIIEQEESFRIAMLKSDAALKRYKGLFFDHEKLGSFKLNQQKSMTKLLLNHDITLINIGWLSELLFKSASLHREQMRLNITGNTEHIAEFIYALENQQRLVSIDQMSLNFRGVDFENGGNADASLLLSFYFKVPSGGAQ